MASRILLLVGAVSSRCSNIGMHKMCVFVWTFHSIIPGHAGDVSDPGPQTIDTLDLLLVRHKRWIFIVLWIQPCSLRSSIELCSLPQGAFRAEGWKKYRVWRGSASQSSFSCMRPVVGMYSATAVVVVYYTVGVCVYVCVCVRECGLPIHHLDLSSKLDRS